MTRPFRVPLAPLTCLLGAVFCGGMAYFLPNGTWWHLAIWTALGLLIYGLYGYRNSRLRKHTPEELNMRPHPPEVVPASSASGYDLRPLNAAEREAYAASLTNEERHVILHQGTERAFGGALLHNKASGIYACRLCGLPLFKASAKFESGSGWPSFFQPFDDLHVREVRDTSHGMTRVEIRCRRCDGHLGHVFDDGPAPTYKRHCMNSVSLQFVPEGEEPAQRVAGD